MIKEFDITIPSTARDIKLRQWQTYIDVHNKNKDAEDTDFLEKKIISIFCDVSVKDVNSIPFSVYNEVLSHLTSIINEKPKLVQRFKLEGTDGVVVEFGLIPNFDKMTYGEFIDLEKYLFDEKNLHRAMAVLYRPLKSSYKDDYLIHDYQGTEFYAELMKDTPLDVALASRVFFYRLATKLGNYTMAYTLKELQQKNLGKEDELSVKNGESIKQYLHSLEMMSEKLERLQNFQYINV